MIFDSLAGSNRRQQDALSHYDVVCSRKDQNSNMNTTVNFNRDRHRSSTGSCGDNYTPNYGQSQTYNPYTMGGLSTVRRSLRSKPFSPSLSKRVDGRMFHVTSQIDFGDKDRVNMDFRSPYATTDSNYTLRSRAQGHRGRHHSGSTREDYYADEGTLQNEAKREPSSSSSSRSRSNSRHHLNHLDRRPCDAFLSILQPPQEYASPSIKDEHRSRRSSHHDGRHRDPDNGFLNEHHSSDNMPSKTREQSIRSKSYSSSIVKQSSSGSSRHPKDKSLTRRVTTSSPLSPSILNGSSFDAFHDLGRILGDTINKNNNRSLQYASSNQNHFPVYASSNSVASMMILLPDPPQETYTAMDYRTQQHIYPRNQYDNGHTTRSDRTKSSNSNPYLLSDGFEAGDNGVIYSQIVDGSHDKGSAIRSASDEQCHQRHQSRSRSREKVLDDKELSVSGTLYSTRQRRPSRKQNHAPPLSYQTVTRHQNMMDPRSVYGYVGPSLQRDNYYYYPTSIGSNLQPSTVKSCSEFTKSCQNIPNAGLAIVTSIPSLIPPPLPSSQYANPKNTHPLPVPVVASKNCNHPSKIHPNSSSSSTTSGDNYYRSPGQSNLAPTNEQHNSVKSFSSKVASPSSASTASSSVSSSSGPVKSNTTATTPMYSSQSSNATTNASKNDYHLENSCREINRDSNYISSTNSTGVSKDKTDQAIVTLASNPSLDSDEHLLLSHHLAEGTADEDEDEGIEGLEICNAGRDVEAHIESMNGIAGHSSKSEDGSHSRSHHHRRRHRSRRSREEMNCCLKYTLFGVNTIAWLVGFLVMMIGIWAWNEKDYLSNLTNIPLITLDPAFALIVIGLISFVIGFVGCMGALRQNSCLLATYSIFLIGLLILELSLSVLAFIMKDWIRSQASSTMQAFIVYYRDDPDRQNLIDWIQESWLECCGIDGPRDWDMNIYFNCSSVAQGSREACGVPFSCCRNDLSLASPLSAFDDSVILKNKQCGYDVRKVDYMRDRSSIISEKGCLRAGEEWIEGNFLVITMSSLALASIQREPLPARIRMKGCMRGAEDWFKRNLIKIVCVYLIYNFFQILAICISQNLRSDIVNNRLKMSS